MRTIILVLGLLSTMAAPGLRGQTPEPVVHAVLFFSPTCGHCHQLINEHLIPMQERYGRSLVILGMDTSQSRANNLYWETIRHFELPEEDWVVPMMVIGDEVLIGGITIPARLTRAMEEDLQTGGIDLPNYAPLVDLLREQDALDPRYPDRLIIRQDPAAGESPPPSDPDPTHQDSASPSIEAEEPDTAPPAVPSADTVVVAPDGTIEEDSAAASEAGPTEAEEVGPAEAPDTEAPEPLAEEVPQAQADEAVRTESPETTGAETADSSNLPAGFSLTENVRAMEDLGVWERFNLDPKGNSLSVLVLLAMILSLALRGYPPNVGPRPWPTWVIPALVVVGASVAAYLSFIEVTQTDAVCGPVGDCNTVNQSPYATLFGVLPVGILGLIGYGLVLTLWLAWRSTGGSPRRKSALGLWLVCLMGTVFSIYLTFLEPFVIGATCIWCLTSAVVMTLLLWASAPLAAAVWTTEPPSTKEA